MRISCDRCGSKARISTTSKVTDQLSKLYCACTNVECGHTFVMHLEFGHTISPSVLDLPEATRDALRDCANPAQAQLVLAG
ncbi:ogr/Delta-like zinc finger family protein [Desulfocurvibacter africanus]|uniref:Transcriptional activator Ogr/delta n=1 Tax=Desulfocurvibacter africanus subsp. africanus str. Walvis Bay TaxID=690850 RepID=F3YWS5_DESAF|nr:ogr/Delta-like zinc finger family protein [Desulfocurvibacter africanus]EGJ51649.1 transcriptional activator Ogr/delta [Desulfocurvibacter africanus subsp. africanus str. Walvis Bay]